MTVNVFINLGLAPEVSTYTDQIVSYLGSKGIGVYLNNFKANSADFTEIKKVSEVSHKMYINPSFQDLSKIIDDLAKRKKVIVLSDNSRFDCKEALSGLSWDAGDRDTHNYIEGFLMQSWNIREVVEIITS